VPWRADPTRLRLRGLGRSRPAVRDGARAQD